MATTKVTTKYQIVIPKIIRQQASIKEGQELYIYLVGKEILLSPKKKWPNDYIGSQKDIWKNVDVAKYLKEERNSWDE